MRRPPAKNWIVLSNLTTAAPDSQRSSCNTIKLASFIVQYYSKYLRGLVGIFLSVIEEGQV